MSIQKSLFKEHCCAKAAIILKYALGNYVQHSHKWGYVTLQTKTSVVTLGGKWNWHI